MTRLTVPPWKGKNRKSEYLSQIQKYFPKLRYKKSRTIRHGWDHDVVVLDEKYIFRFPKKDYGKRFRAEVRLLKEIRPLLNVSVPHYEYLPKDLSFGGYKIIKGRMMMPSGFRRLSQKKRESIAAQLGEFLTRLHSVPIAKAERAGFEEEKGGYWWSRLRCQRNLRMMRKLLFPKLLKREVKWIEERFAEYHACAFNFEPVVLHNDLSEEHILYNPQAGKVTGIIDFADVEVGDPAIDFAFFWQYGEQFVHNVLQHYTCPVDDDFLIRALFPRRIYMVNDMLEMLEGSEMHRPFEHFYEKLRQEMKRDYA